MGDFTESKKRFGKYENGRSWAAGREISEEESIKIDSDSIAHAGASPSHPATRESMSSHYCLEIGAWAVQFSASLSNWVALRGGVQPAW
jgi:hypothetical protein